MNRSSQPAPVLHRGKHLSLRRTTPADAELLFEQAFGEPEFMRLFRLNGENQSVEQLRQRLQLQWKLPPNKSGYLEMLVIHKEHGPVGVVALADYSPLHRRAETLTGIFKAYRHLGYGAEAKLLMLDMGFNRYGLHKIDAYTYAYNLEPQHAMLRLGFRDEGVRRGHLYSRDEGRFVDLCAFGMMLEEFRNNALLVRLSRRLIGHDITRVPKQHPALSPTVSAKAPAPGAGQGKLPRKRVLAAAVSSKLGTTLPVMAADYDVTAATDDGTGATANTLSWAIRQANLNPGADTITLNTDVSLTGIMKSLIDGAPTAGTHPGGDLILQSDATQRTISGTVSTDATAFSRPLFVKSGNVLIRNLTLSNGTVFGGVNIFGEYGGGGGAGLGGALFIQDGSVVVQNVHFYANRAYGGGSMSAADIGAGKKCSGGKIFGSKCDGTGSGGGGGMPAGVAEGDFVYGAGGGGMFGGTAYGDAVGGYDGTGNYGGYGGAVDGGPGGFGGGGGAGADANPPAGYVGGAGGAGGFGGGGGFGGESECTDTVCYYGGPGGHGGFGGGGGAGGIGGYSSSKGGGFQAPPGPGGTGGFGAGGGMGTPPGTGGYGGGNADSGAGGGGAGFGGAIFAMNGTTTLIDVSFAGNTTYTGTSKSGGGTGIAAGNDVFICSDQDPMCGAVVNACGTTATSEVVGTFGSDCDNTMTVSTSGSGGMVSSAPPGIDCGSACSAVFPLNSTITLNAAAVEPGVTLSQTWGGDCAHAAGGTICMVTMIGDRQADITFDCHLWDIPETVSPAVTAEESWQCAIIQATNGFVVDGPTGNVTFQAETGIELGTGFSVMDQARFKALITP